MLRADTIDPVADPAPRPDAANRRLAAGLLLSLLVHAIILSLQFDVSGMARLGARSAIDITLAHVLPPAPEPVSEAAQSDPVPPATPPRPPAPVVGMTLVDPAPPPPPPPAPRAIKKDKPRKARRISTPLPKPEADAPVRVIAQESNPDSDFVVPLPQPEDSLQKTIDVAEAQHGSDDMAEVAQEEQPIAEPEQPALALREAREREAREQQDRLAAQQRAEDERIAAAAREQELVAQQRLAQELADRQKAAELIAQEQAARREADEALKQQRLAQERAERQRSDEALAQQRLAQEHAERQRSEERLAQQRRDQELAERKRAEEILAQQRIAQEMAERQRLEQLAARRLAEEGARLQAERDREAALARAEPAGDPSGSPEGQGGGRGKAAAGNYGSDLANRVRDLSKGLDLLSGTPPRRPGAGESAQRRVVADSAERDVPLRMYVESWRQKVERNGNMNFPRLIGERARIDPLVSVAVRSDGSVEDVTIIRSSGRSDTDDAVRRIVRINALYSRFPPNIASRYDVIEIRRIWTFDQVLKLIEEVR